MHQTLDRASAGTVGGACDNALIHSYTARGMHSERMGIPLCVLRFVEFIFVAATFSCLGSCAPNFFESEPSRCLSSCIICRLKQHHPCCMPTILASPNRGDSNPLEALKMSADRTERGESSEGGKAGRASFIEDTSPRESGSPTAATAHELICLKSAHFSFSSTAWGASLSSTT